MVAVFTFRTKERLTKRQIEDEVVRKARHILKRARKRRDPMSTPLGFTVKVRDDRDIIISKPEDGFEVRYRREVYYPMLIASDVLRNDFDESKVMLLAQAWKVALNRAKSLGWLDDPRQKRKPRAKSKQC